MNKIILMIFMLLTSFVGFSQLDEEGFEGTWPPPGWNIFNVAGPNFTWTPSDPLNPLQAAYEGTYAAYLQRENVTSGTTEDWLVTPQFPAPANAQLRFFSKLTIGGNQGSVYQIRLSENADQMNQGQYSIIQTWTETQINPSQESWFEKIVDLPASVVAGDQIYIAFVMLGDNGDRWLIDNVSVVEECLLPTAQAATGITENSANLPWTNPGNVTNWEIELIEFDDPFTGVPNITYAGLPPYPATGLLPATGYKYKVRAVCAAGQTSEWSNTISFTTLFEPPVNDGCANAIALTVNPTNICAVSTPGTVNAATASPEPSTCTGTENDDVWYTFTATNTTHLISFINVTGSTTDLVHVLYSGAGCGSLTQMYCSDPNNSTATGLTVGASYFVRVYSWSATAQTTVFNICIGTPPPPPANDNCAGAIMAPVNSDLICAASTTGTIYSATASPQANACTGTADDDVWYTFIATSTSHTINLNNITGSTTNLNHAVYSGACGSLTQLYCSDPNNSIAGNLVPGQTYTIRIYSSLATVQTSVFDLCIGTPPPPPVNDGCAGAITAPVNPDLLCAQTVPGTIAWSTPSAEGGTTCLGTEDDDVWYTFTATNTSHTINLNNITGSTTDLVHSVYSGTCAGLTQMYCSDPNNSIAGGLTPGQTYFIRIYSWTATGGQTSVFNVCVGTPPPPPANDECASATIAPVNADMSCAQTVPGTIAWATPSIQATTCAGTEDDDVWFEFVATNAVHTINLNNVTGSTTDLNHTLYLGDQCGSLTDVYCNANNNSIASGLTVGATYKLRVFTATATGGQTTTFVVCIGTPPPPPANDGCAGAITAPVNPDLLCGQVVPGTIAWATPSTEGGTACVGTEDDDVWYTFTATNSIHTINLNNVAGSTTDLVHGLYSGSCAGLVQVYCSDANNSIATGLVPGQTYYIRVFTWTATTGQTSTFNLCIGTPPPPPVNDDCAAATIVPINPTQVCNLVTPGTIAWSTASIEASTCTGTDDDDVWYEFVATNTTHLISFLNVVGSDINHALYVGDQCGALLTQVYCNANNNSTATGLTIGLTYKIRVYTSTATAGQTTTFDVCVGTPPPPPVNDECAGAITVPVNPTMECAQTVDGILYSATASAQASTCTVVADDDVWFEFVATGTAHIISLLNVTGSSTNVYHALYAGDQCGALTPISCNDANLTIAQNLVPGTTYKVRVWSNLTTPQTTEFEICIGTPPVPGTNDDCASALPVPVNQNSSCELFTTGTVYGATASPEASTCAGTEDDDVWFEFIATHTTHLVSLQNVQGTVTALNHALYAGDICGSLTQLLCSADGSIEAPNLIVGNTYKIRVFSAAATLQSITFDVCVRIPNTPISVNDTQYTVPQLVSEVLIDSDCALVSNITWSTGSNFGAANGIGYFDASASDFPFENGVILSTGSIQEVVGGAAGSTTGWPGDLPLTAIAQAFNPLVTDTNNASVLEFDFVPLTNQFTFDFMFASEEYGTFQCGGFADAFAFLLTGPSPSTATENLAVIPGTNIPVLVTTIRDQANNASCPSENIEYFGQYNADDPAAAAITFNGQTVAMQASADVVPGQLYHIKLVIADANDAIFNSAVFLGGGSFDIGDIDLGGDLLLSENTAVCDEDTVTLDTELSATDFTFVWEKDDVVIPTATGPSLVVTEPGVYSVVASFPNVACSYQGEVTIEFYPDIEDITGDPADLTYCDASGFHTFDLSVNTTAILAPLADPDAYTVDYYLSEADALADEDPITNFTAFQNTVTDLQTIYVRILDQEGGCAGIKTFDLIIQDLTPQFDLTEDQALCGDETAVLTVTPINFDPSSPDVAFAWTLDGDPLPDTTASITTTGAGTYEVTVSNTQCTASQTVEVTVSPTPEATIEYGGPYCSNAANVSVTFTGTTGGTFSGTTGLVIDPVTGEVNLAASTAATHTVTYSIAATPSCGPLVITDEIVITPAPDAEFTYDSLVFCQSATSTAAPTFNGDAVAGTFTVNQTGLTIDPSTGIINPATSTIGDYIVTNTIAAANGCAQVTDIQTVSIIAAPIATFNYGITEFCPEGTVSPNITGATGGSFSAPDGLSIDETTGIIDLAGSDAGTYTVRYTIAATAECAEEFQEITVTVKPRPIFNLGGPYVVCDASFATISVNAENFNTADATYVWTLDDEVLPDTGSSIVATGFGNYEVIVTLNGCSDIASVQVTQETAAVDFTLFEGCVDNVYRLEVIPGVNNDNTSFDPDTTTFTWTVPSEFTGTVPTTWFIEPNAPGLYTVTFTTAGGCTATDGFTVTATSCQIQKGISPGDADNNNFFDLTALNVVHLSIFNRYGQEVFSYGNYTNEWGGQDNSGNELPTGTYFYSLERSNGETRTGWVYINRQN